MRKKTLAAFLAGIMLLLSGCSIGKTDVVFTTGLSSKEVFKIEGETVKLPQAKVYLCNYQNLYGTAYGIDLWEQDFQKKDLEAYVKDVTIAEMTRVMCMDQLAEQKEITLTDAEKERMKQAAEEYYDSLSKEELQYMDVSRSDIEDLYNDYALAQKVYTTLTTGINEEVSDDEARVMDAMQIYVKDQTKAGEVASQLASGRDFYTVAADYNELGRIEVSFGRGVMPQEVEDVAFNLDNEQVSESIATDDGYYFIKCINKFNEPLTQQNRVKILEDREKSAFNDEYEEFVSGLNSSLNIELWEQLELKLDGTIKTNSFFMVFDKYYTKED